MNTTSKMYSLDSIYSKWETACAEANCSTVFPSMSIGSLLRAWVSSFLSDEGNLDEVEEVMQEYFPSSISYHIMQVVELEIVTLLSEIEQDFKHFFKYFKVTFLSDFLILVNGE